MATLTPLIVITGPTGSGKSSLALELAKKYGGEIICADSRTVFKGMDIGTAKPTQDERLFVPHHLLDVVEPNEAFSAADFQTHARQAIKEIRERGNVPFLVGGTGLYIDSIVLDYKFDSAPDPQKRKLLEEKSVEELTSLIKDQQISMPLNSLNKRHLVRALELKGVSSSRKKSPDQNTYVVSITTQKEVLMERITARADDMFAHGVVEEAEQLAQQYGWDNESMTGNIYPILREVIEGRMSEDEAKKLFIIRDRQLVKKQLTWLKRHNYIDWLSLEDARHKISDLLDRTVR